LVVNMPIGPGPEASVPPKRQIKSEGTRDDRLSTDTGTTPSDDDLVWEETGTKIVKANGGHHWETFLSSKWLPADDATYKIRVDEKSGMYIGVVCEGYNGVWIGGDSGGWFGSHEAGFCYSSGGQIYNASQWKFRSSQGWSVEAYGAGDVIGIQIRDAKISFTKNRKKQGGELKLLKGEKIRLGVVLRGGQVTIQ